MILCIGDTTPTYKLSDILFEYDAVFDERYAAAIGEFYVWRISIPYTKITLMHYERISKKDTTKKICSQPVFSIQELLFLFIDKSHDFTTLAPTLKFLTKINGVLYQHLARELEASGTYYEPEK